MCSVRLWPNVVEPQARHYNVPASSDLIFLKQDSWRDKDKLDVQAMKEILARESKRK
jgi:hypothetical protein